MSTSNNKKKSSSVADDIQDSFQQFPAYADGSLFIAMRYWSDIQERLRAADFAIFEKQLQVIASNRKSTDPEKQRLYEEGREAIKATLQPYGQDLVDRWDEFEKCAGSMAPMAGLGKQEFHEGSS